MKILWLTPIFPYPPFSGGQTRAYNLLKNLAKKNEITLFSFWRPGRIQGPQKEMEKFCLKVKIFPGRPIWSPRNLLLAGFSHLPFAITHFYNDLSMTRAIQDELADQKYDLVHFESFYTSCYLKTNLGMPTVLGNENIEYLVYQRFIKQKKFLPLKILLGFDIWKMKKFEESVWKKANLNLAVSQKDADKIKKVTGKKCIVIANGVDVKHFENFKSLNHKQSQTTFLFVGDFKYFTNQDAIKFLTQEIWPAIKTKIPQAKLWLVGKNTKRLAKKISHQDVVVDNTIDDIRQAYFKADIMLAPLRIASGTNIKILEAMAAGLPVVTTPVGIEGIAAGGAVIGENKQALVAKAVELAQNKSQQEKLGAVGKKLVEKFYDWPKIALKLEKAYQELING